MKIDWEDYLTLSISHGEHKSGGFNATLKVEPTASRSQPFIEDDFAEDDESEWYEEYEWSLSLSVAEHISAEPAFCMTWIGLSPTLESAKAKCESYLAAILSNGELLRTFEVARIQI